MKKIFVTIPLLLIIMLIRCTHDSGKISIIPIKMLDYTDTSKFDNVMTIDKSNSFLVLNFSDNKRNEEYLESFVLKNIDTSFEKYTNYSIVFYKQSSVTNIVNIEANPRIIDKYSQDNDLIYSYEWVHGKSLSKFRFKNGMLINSKVKNLTIEDVPENN